MIKMVKPLIKKSFSNFYWFFTYLRHKIFVGIILSILVGLLDGFGLTMFLPLLQMVSTDVGSSVESMGSFRFLIEFIEAIGFDLSLGVVLFFMLFFFVLKGIAKYVSLVYRVKLQQELIKNICLKMLYALNNVKFKFFVTSDVGRIQNTMTGEVDRIQTAYISYFSAFEQIILVVVYMSFAFFVDFQFALLVSVGGILTNFSYKIIYTYTKNASKKFTDESNKYQGNVIQYVANFKYLRATAMIENFTKRLENTIQNIEASRKRIGILSSLLEASREPLLMGVVAIVILIQVNVLKGSLGPILISLLFFYRALTALTSMQNTWNKFLGVSGSLDNLQDFQQTLMKNQDDLGYQPFVYFQQEIKVAQVSFSYRDEHILKDITLSIKKNHVIAFVGESGSGKTTLVNLICALLPPSSGEILVDGTSLKKLQRNAFQKRIGYITQEPVIFNDTIFNNVTFWDEHTLENEQKFINALQKASVYHFVKEQPLGLDTVLGNNGINLSGGQKQRISIARELYKDIDILIMDEATSALDSETEKIIQENIDALKGKYTIMIVAHRLSTIKNADSIVLMDKGRIIEQDNFEALVKRIPRFKKMVEFQEI
jgi:ABC-type multidrug transport system fused ATPase/permease subunit